MLRRPAFAPVPALAVKALYGEMADIVITGQRAVPAQLTELGYALQAAGARGGAARRYREHARGSLTIGPSW